MKKRNTAFLALLLTLVLSSTFISGCKPPPLSSKEQAFADIIPVPYHELNTILKLDTPPGMNDYKFGNSIGFEVLNESRVPISLPPDHGIKLYTYDEISEEWVEIENIVEYLPIGNAEIWPASYDGPGGPETSVYPDIQDFSKPITVRILMVGELADEKSSTGTLVGAYIDVTLVP